MKNTKTTYLTLNNVFSPLEYEYIKERMELENFDKEINKFNIVVFKNPYEELHIMDYFCTYFVKDNSDLFNKTDLEKVQRILQIKGDLISGISIFYQLSFQ